MHILLIHQNFPAQFRHLAPALAAAGHEVVALTVNPHAGHLPGVRIVDYRARLTERAGRQAAAGNDEWQAKAIRGAAAADAMEGLKASGFRPDVVFAHPGWGEALFVRSVFPDARLLVHAEYFYGTAGGDVGFDPEFQSASPDNDRRVIVKNTHLLHALNACDAAVSPTEFQRNRHPAWAQERIQVIHEGIDTARFHPNPDAWIQLRTAGIKLRQGDEVITFVARQLEPYRGFHIFMRALPLIQKLRPQARVVLVGGEGTSYGAAAPPGQTWRKIFLAEVAGQVDLSRVHFVGKVPHHLLTQLMQVSAAHVYLTYPFVLSWSMLEAMSIGCLVVGSNTAPVREVIEDGRNGLLTDFFDPERLAHRVAFALENRSRLGSLREAARQTAIDRYDLTSICLPRQIEFTLGIEGR